MVHTYVFGEAAGDDGSHHAGDGGESVGDPQQDAGVPTETDTVQ